MDNQTFLNVLKESFKTYLDPGTRGNKKLDGSRSNKKLKVLHGEIAKDIDNKIKNKNTDKTTVYTVSALGFGNGKEEKIQGRYYEKKIDIAIKNPDKVIAGIAVK
ncbi:MAG: hypothetical protein IKH45_07850, partial [Neisseriaceae bacterium]|nr:hypothetical protein [Neisseriaceae bacterium]